MPVNRYKDAEREFATRMAAWYRRIQMSLAGPWRWIKAEGKQRFTVKVITPSADRPLNLQVSIWTLLYIALMVGIALTGSILLVVAVVPARERNLSLSQRVKTCERTLSRLKDQVADIRAAGKRLNASVTQVIPGSDSDAAQVSPVNRVAANMSVMPDDAQSGVDQLAELRTVTALLQSSSDSLDAVRRGIGLFQDLLASTPTTWPLKGGVGVITTKFGWTTNPFSKVGYMHTGIDIAWSFGTPVMATADGVIVQAGWNDDLGNYVVIQHRFGFSTRYSHLSQITKPRGTAVRRGEIIGLLGSTGLSTGPHVDYVVRLGLQYINPVPFLSIKQANRRALNTGRNGD